MVRLTEPLSYSIDETLDVGSEGGTVVAEDYTARTSTFTGEIAWVQLDQGADDHDHLVSPEERLRVALARPRARGHWADGPVEGPFAFGRRGASPAEVGSC